MNVRNPMLVMAAAFSSMLAVDLHAQILQPAPRPANNPPGTLAPRNPQARPAQQPPSDAQAAPNPQGPTPQPDPNAQENRQAQQNSQPQPINRQDSQRPESLDPPGTLKPDDLQTGQDERSDSGAAADLMGNTPQNFAKADNDRDGVVSRDELRGYGSDSGMAFEELDQNSDGTISGNEWASYRDINGDDPSEPE